MSKKKNKLKKRMHIVDVVGRRNGDFHLEALVEADTPEEAVVMYEERNGRPDMDLMVYPCWVFKRDGGKNNAESDE